MEAVIEILVNAPDDLIASELSNHFEREKTQYSEQQEVLSFEGSITIDATGAIPASAASRRDLKGYVYVDRKHTRLFQARTDGFLFSKQAPYDRWESIRDEAQRLWLEYVAVARPVTTRRLGLRYVNRLDLPAIEADLSDYLLTRPEVAPGISRRISGYAMQLDIPLVDAPDTMMIIREAVVQPIHPETIAIVFDIDILRVGEYHVTDHVIWQAFEELHSRVSETFERSITDRLRELIS